MKDRTDKGVSRRRFIKTSAAALGMVAVCKLTGIVSAGQTDALKALPSKKTKEEIMPHVSVKLWPGRSEQDKKRLAEAIAEDVVRIIQCDEASVSVAIEEINREDWKEKVYDPEIRGNMDKLYKRPGYSM
jgi:4-oxalocrotonate tautomerase